MYVTIIISEEVMNLRGSARRTGRLRRRDGDDVNTVLMSEIHKK